MRFVQTVIPALLFLDPLTLEARLPAGGPNCGDAPCPPPPTSSQTDDVEAPAPPFERDHQALFSWSFDNLGRYIRTGGHLRFSFALTRRYGLGLQAGLISIPPDTEVPFSLVNGWEFSTINGRVNIMLHFVTGVSLAWNAHNDAWDGDETVTTTVLHILIELGVKIRINPIVGIAMLAHGGVGIIEFESRRPIIGGHVGPVFHF